jgi:hypothetical protein
VNGVEFQDLRAGDLLLGPGGEGTMLVLCNDGQTLRVLRSDMSVMDLGLRSLRGENVQKYGWAHVLR